MSAPTLHQSAQRCVDDVSHELRSPLAVVKEYCSLVRDGLAGPTTVRQQEFLGVALCRIDDMSRLVDDMLDISKIETGVLTVKRERASIDKILCAVWPTLERRASQKKVTLELATDDALDDVYCDVEKAGRTLLNLAINAIKFTPTGGKVTVAAEAVPDASSDAPIDGAVRISVADSGPGIAADDLREIFQRFNQLTPGRLCAIRGYGLGLGIARELAGLNLGGLSATSEPGRGSTFSFTLPLAEPSTAFRRQLETWLAQATGSRRVSLVRASLPYGADEEWRTAADEVLQSFGAGDQFTYRVAGDTWLVAVRGAAAEFNNRRRDVSKRWQEWRRNSPIAGECELSLALLGAWRADLQTAALCGRFRTAALQGAAIDPDMAAGACAIGAPRVLLVDDDAELSRALDLRMRAAGYEVLTAGDAERGVVAARDNHPDAIVLDLRPEGDDSLAALNRLKGDRDTKDIPVVMLSASIADQQRALDQGARFFLTKPFDAASVVCAVESSMA